MNIFDRIQRAREKNVLFIIWIIIRLSFQVFLSIIVVCIFCEAHEYRCVYIIKHDLSQWIIIRVKNVNLFIPSYINIPVMAEFAFFSFFYFQNTLRMKFQL